MIGAGLAGLALARRLHETGFSVDLFDKGRSPGGRMSTRREGAFQFDHGAQFFTVRDARFQEAVDAWVERGVVAPWDATVVRLNNGAEVAPAESVTRYVGVPSMSAICRDLADGLTVSSETRVVGATRMEGRWRLSDVDGNRIGDFDTLVVNAPPEQAAPFLSSAPDLLRRVLRATMAPNWTTMVSFDPPVAVEWDAAFVADSPLSWVARNASKPQRPRGDEWILQASSKWSSDHLDLPSELVAVRLLDAFSKATGVQEVRTQHLRAHRWRYANTEQPMGMEHGWDQTVSLGVCGDWCFGGRVEDAYVSGITLAEKILERYAE